MVFSSKRAAPLFNRPYIAYFFPDGRCARAFILPQEDPAYYDSELKTYTMPTLATGPITIPETELLRAIKAKHKQSLLMPGPPAEEWAHSR